MPSADSELVLSYLTSQNPRRRQLLAHISGSYSGIMGLPLFETVQLLRAAGAAACGGPGVRKKAG